MTALTEEQRRAYALDALNNPVLGDTLQHMENAVLAKWKGTTRQDTAAREQAWMEFQAIRSVKAGIESVLAEANAENETEDESL